MKSVRTKIEMTVITCLVVVFVVISGIYAYNLYSVNRSNGESYIWEICRESRQSFDDRLKRMEMAVDLIKYHTMTYVNNTDEDEAVRMAKFKASAESTARYTQNVSTVFYKANPNRFDSRYDFLFMCDNENGMPVEGKPKDIAAFEKETGQPANWYYEAAEIGEPCWIDPYMLKLSSGKTEPVTAYVMPLFNAYDQINGVVGMELSLQLLIEEVNSVRLYNSGYMFLTASDGTVLAHPSYPYGTKTDEVLKINWSTVEELLNEKNPKRLIPYTLEGEARMMAATRLENNMVLIASVPTSEIDSVFLKTIKNSLVGFLFVILISVIIVFRLIHRLLTPIKTLSDASQKIMEGNMDIKIDYKGKDEIGILAENFSKMAMRLNQRLEKYSTMAYTDAMTGVKNKASYESAVKVIEEKISSGSCEFGVVVIDLNNLKLVNDKYGHEAGDNLIKAATRVICRTFAHSPVFRIGGDEFVALLERDDYKNKDQLFEKMQVLIQETNKELTKEHQVSFAYGYAEYEPQKDSTYHSVFERADKLMYENKRAIKAKR